GRLGVDDPVMAEQKSEPGSEDPGFCQGREAAVELECAVAEGGFESGNELTAKEPAEHLDGKKKGAARGDPTGVVGGEAASGDYAVNVRMMMQALIPGMEHAEKADLCTKMMGIAGDLEQGLGTGVKQQAVDHALVLQGERRQFPRQGEDSMHVAGRQQFAFPRLKPVQAGGGLALGTVTVTTRVVRDGGMSTLGALIAMPTERGGPTACNRCQHLCVLAVDPVAIALSESRSGGANDIGHLQRRPRHACRLGSSVAAKVRASRGLPVALRRRRDR